MHSPEGKLTLKAFWYCYRFIHPDHIVFHTPGIDLGLCIPVLIHGDSGRTLKKSPFEVVSWQVVFGSKRKSSCDDGEGPARKKTRTRPGMFERTALKRKLEECGDDDQPAKYLRAALEQKANVTNNSFLTRQLVFAVRKSTLKNKDRALHELLHDVVAKDLTDLFHDGVTVDSQHVRLATVASKGDWEWHTRSDL